MKEQKILLDEDVYVFLAPDGTPQSMSVAETYEESIAIMELMSQTGLAKPVGQLFSEGYHIVKARVKFVQLLSPEETFDEFK